MTDLRSWQEQDLQRWLGREAPRYTSYPSAHHFEALEPEKHKAWIAALPAGQSIGLYVHVPFCAEMCWFCGCNTQITKRYEPIEAYVDNLIAEVALVSAVLKRRATVHSLHFGGGSPGLLQPDTLARLFDALRGAFVFLPDAEISIELDPRQLTPERVGAYARHGFNRASLGVQDTDPKVQTLINRVQPLDMVLRGVDLLRNHGIDAIGIDLVYGLPGQTEDSLMRTLSDVSRIAPDRISAFSYAHVPWVKKHQRLLDEAQLPDTAAKAGQYLLLSDGLCSLGFTAVGMDHFACAKDGLARATRDGTLRRNFMGYTDQPNDRLLALGASSISGLDDGMAQNSTKATSYETLVRSGQLPTVRGWRYRDDDKVRAAVIGALMCRFEADVGAILVRHGLSEDSFDAEIASLAECVEAGLVTIDGRRVRFVSPYRMLVRTVACAFDRYARQTSEGNRYSKVA